EIDSLLGKVREKGLTLVPTRLYFKDGRAKVELAIARGKEHRDKRRDIAKRDADRQIERALKSRRRWSAGSGSLPVEGGVGPQIARAFRGRRRKRVVTREPSSRFGTAEADAFCRQLPARIRPALGAVRDGEDGFAMDGQPVAGWWRIVDSGGHTQPPLR